jgi:hypothetical protein
MNLQLNWRDGRDYCQKKGMQLASLKTLTQVEAVAKKLSSRAPGNISRFYEIIGVPTLIF